MKNELHEALNEYGITTDEFTKALSMFISGLQTISHAINRKLSNNYLKMHGYTIRRSRALKIFERRHRSG